MLETLKGPQKPYLGFWVQTFIFRFFSIFVFPPMASYKWPYWPSLMSYYPDFLWLTRVFLGGLKNPIQGLGSEFSLKVFFKIRL